MKEKDRQKATYRRDREAFERLARGLALAKRPTNSTGAAALVGLFTAGRFLRFRVAPAHAVAYVKVCLASREKAFSVEERRHLRMLAAMALVAIEKKALAPRASGIGYALSVHEERRLTRACRGLVRLFEARRERVPTLEEVNQEVARVYPPETTGMKLTAEQLTEVLTHRSPRRRAIGVLDFLLALGKKAIEARCYAAHTAHKDSIRNQRS